MSKFPDTQSVVTLEAKIDMLASVVELPRELRRAIHWYRNGDLQAALAMFEDENFHDIAELLADRMKQQNGCWNVFTI